MSNPTVINISLLTPKKIQLYKFLSLLFAGLALIIGIVDMVIWFYDDSRIHGLFKQFLVSPNISVALILSGLASSLLSYDQLKKSSKYFIIACGLCLGLYSILALFNVLLDINYYPYQFTTHAVLNNPIILSYCFLLISVVILLEAFKVVTYLRSPINFAFAMVVIIVSAINLIGYLSHQIELNPGIQIGSAIALQLLGIALLLRLLSEGDILWALNKLLTLSVGLAVIIMLIIFSGANYLSSQLEAHTMLSYSSNADINRMEAIFRNLSQYNYSQNMFLLSNNPKFIEQQNDYKNRLMAHLKVFEANVKADEIKQVYLRRIDTLIAERFEKGQQLLNSQKGKSALSQQQLELLDQNMNITYTLFELINKLQKEEFAYLNTHEHQQDMIVVRTYQLLSFCVIYGLTILLLAMFFMNRGTIEKMLAIERKTERENLVAAIVNSSDDAIIGKDLKGNITSWNKAAERIFGYQASEIIGRSVLDLIPADRKKEEPDIINNILKGKRVHLETVRRTKRGELFDASITVSPIKNRSGEILGISSTVRDVTKKKQLEQQLRQSQKMEAIGQLTGGVAHDFNNILGIIIGNIDLAMHYDKENETVLKKLKTASDAALRAADITKRLLSFSCLQPLNPKLISISESIKNCIQMISPGIGTDIKIVVNIEDNMPSILVDATEFETAIVNLMINARDAMPKGGTINIEAKPKYLDESHPAVIIKELEAGNYVKIMITDSGVGMSRETIERAFEPFFTTKDHGKGTGLGLSMVYGFIKQSHGYIKIYSEIEHGTNITMYLPFVESKQSKHDPHPIMNQLKDKKLTGAALVVDDEKAILDIAVSYLQDIGLKVYQATTPQKGIAIVNQNPDIDLLVTDVIMPEMNGVELAEKIRQLNPDIVVVYSSGFSYNKLSERSDLQMDAPFIHKPYQRQEFVSKVLEALAEKKNCMQ